MRDQNAANPEFAGRAAMLPARPRRAVVVALLLLACFLPRVIAAWQWDVLWCDSLHYVDASVALEQGDFKKGFDEFGLNIYPLMLIAIRRLGVDWQLAGKWFSVLAATFTVVPIWAWLRRMFDDRTATLACLVYALHGKLIAISPLIIRDPTFWFLFATALYLLWRAAREARLAIYLAAGAVLTLAIYTRTEGWLLLVPLAGWTLCRWLGLEGWTSESGGECIMTRVGGVCAMTRLRLTLGLLLCLAVLPASLAAVNATWLRQQPRWELLRQDHWQIISDLWNLADSAKPAPAPDPPRLAPHPSAQVSPGKPRAAGYLRSGLPADKALPASIVLPPAEPREKALSFWVLAFKLLERSAKGATWIGGLLLLVGIVSGWRTFLRAEHLTLLAMNLLLLIVSGIRYRSAGLDLRYFMPLVIVGLPWMARGGELLVTAWANLFGRLLELSPAGRRGAVAFAVALLVACSLADAPLPAAANMRKHAALGRWLREHSPTASPILAGNFGDRSLDAFYADGQCAAFFGPRECLYVPPPAALTARAADFIVLWNSEDLTREQLLLVRDRITGYRGYRNIAAEELPPGSADDDVLVFARK